MRYDHSQGVYLDAYGTLFDVHSVIAACQAMAPDAAALSETWRAKQLEYTWLRALMGHYEDFWPLPMRRCVSPYDATASLWTQPSTPVCWRSNHRLSPYPEVPAALQRLQHYPLAVLSNGIWRMLHAVLEHNKLQGAFTQVLSVDPLRTFNRIRWSMHWHHASRKGWSYVSANAFDVIGAKAFGFYVAWINRTNAPLDELGWQPDVVIQRLDQLPQALHL